MQNVGENRCLESQQELLRAFEAFNDPPAGCIKLRVLQDVLVSYLVWCYQSTALAQQHPHDATPLMQAAHSKDDNHLDDTLQELLCKFCPGSQSVLNYSEMLAQCNMKDPL